VNVDSPNNSHDLARPIAKGDLLVSPPQVLEVSRNGHHSAGTSHFAAFPSAGDLLRAFRQRWGWAVFIGLVVGGALGTLTWFLKPAQYTAAALIRVSSIEPHLLPAEQAAYRADGDAFQRTQMALVKTKRVLVKALQNEKVANSTLVAGQSDPVSWLEEELKVSYIEGTELLRVALSSENAQEATRSSMPSRKPT